MPKFTTYRGMAPGKLVQEFGDKLHINGRVYRTSDLSEIVGKPAMPIFTSASPSSDTWSLRLNRGFQPGTRLANENILPSQQLSDFDAALCGNWAGVTTSGLYVSNKKFRQFSKIVGSSGYQERRILEVDVETGDFFDSTTTDLSNTYKNESHIFLPAGEAGTLAMFRGPALTNSASPANSYVIAYPNNATVSSSLVAIDTQGSTTTSAARMHYRINDNPLRWYFISVPTADITAKVNLIIASVLKTTLAWTTHVSNLSAPASATTVSTTGLGYAWSAPSYAYGSGLNELSSYILWRSATNMEIHRVEIAGTDGTPTVTNNAVTLDQNPMVLHGNTTVPSSVRIQIISHPDGSKYLLVMGFDTISAIPNAAASKLYVYKLTDKNNASFVGEYQLAQSPRYHLASDDSGLRFVMVYNDRYEFWAMGSGGVLSKVDTLYNQRVNAQQFHHADPYGFDATGRFWYITAESKNPSVFAELGINFYSPPGQVNTISVSFDNDNYTYSGAPVTGNLSVAVKDISGAFVAALVNLSPSVNITLSSSSVQTNISGPVLVPFTINAPGDLSVDAWT